MQGLQEQNRKKWVYRIINTRSCHNLTIYGQWNKHMFACFCYISFFFHYMKQAGSILYKEQD